MDLELTDEQTWLSESVDTLLHRAWVPAQAVAEATIERRRQLWEELVAFGALSLGGEDGIGAVEACLIARSLGTHLAAVPYIASATVGLALGDRLADFPTTFALGVLERGSSWSNFEPLTMLRQGSLTGEKVAIEQADLAEQLAVVATLEGEPALAIAPIDAPGLTLSRRPSFDATLPMAAARLDDVAVDESAVLTGESAVRALDRVLLAGSLLVAADALGAANRILDEACRYAAERRQFGRSIASFQSLRHILASMYVRCASGWSAVLYAAAAFDEGAQDAAQTASIAKAYVARAAREVAHGAMQVFGGIAFTAEHPAHRFLRRIIVREQQFGDAAHHERALGRDIANRANEALISAPGAPPA